MKQSPLLSLVSTLFLSACSDPLIGTWEGTDDGVYLRDADGARIKYKFDAAN